MMIVVFFFNVCPQVRLIEGAYVQLEDAYCVRSVEEAMRIAEPIEVRRGSACRGVVSHETGCVAAGWPGAWAIALMKWDRSSRPTCANTDNV